MDSASDEVLVSAFLNHGIKLAKRVVPAYEEMRLRTQPRQHSSEFHGDVS